LAFIAFVNLIIAIAILTFLYKKGFKTQDSLKRELMKMDEKAELKVLKLWRGDEGKNDRPKSIEVEIFHNGSSYKTVILSQENNWAYSWPVTDDASVWTVVERNVPQGYTMTVEERGAAFVLTNTWTPTDPEDPDKPPETGDSSNIMMYVLIMIVSGSMLIFVGIRAKKACL
jgi:LPXTG-motif cell wall-anchored protein